MASVVMKARMVWDCLSLRDKAPQDFPCRTSASVSMAEAEMAAVGSEIFPLSNTSRREAWFVPSTDAARQKSCQSCLDLAHGSS